MDYTIKEYYINNSNPLLEEKIKECLAFFALKSRPLECLYGKTLGNTRILVDEYFQNLGGNTVFYTEDVKRFVIFGRGNQWLEEPFDGESVVLIMGGSLNKNKEETKETLNLLVQTFNIMTKRTNLPIVWCQNRIWRGKALSRIMKNLGAKQLTEKLWIWPIQKNK